MLFNSYEFIFLFLPVSFFIYFYLNNKRLIIASKSWLVFSSLFFYSWWNIIYLPLILTSIIFNYAISNILINYNPDIKKSFKKKSIFIFGLVSNVSLLVYFKYMDFFISNINFITDSNYELLRIALPLAISFFTLQQIAYLVDVYEGEVEEQDFLNYTVFVTFFPQLIAGPIVHHKDMMPQFSKISNKIKNYRNIIIGLFIFSMGLFKKVVIADTFAVWATAGFDTAPTLTFLEAWATSLSYTFQLYFDFSGYTDMAIGIALLFNIKLPINFNSPYKSTGIIEFWQRWHITLSNFITAYIFTPILKSFKNITFRNAMISTIITMLIAGMWHGASWMFIIFGGLHGIALVINNLWSKYGFTLHKTVAWFITFNFINIAWVFFRAKDWDDAIKVLSAMFSLENIVIPEKLHKWIHFLDGTDISFGQVFTSQQNSEYFLLWFMVVVALLLSKNSMELTKYPTLLSTKDISSFKLSYFAIILFIALVAMSLQTYTEFIYFNF